MTIRIRKINIMFRGSNYGEKICKYLKEEDAQTLMTI